MKNNKSQHTLAKVEAFGRKYVKDFLRVDKTVIYNDWYSGLLFFFEKSFYRGRKDSISETFMKRAFQALQEYGLKGNIKSLNTNDLNQKLIDNHVNNKVDRQMVVATTVYIRSLTGFNLTMHTVESIKNGDARSLFTELTNLYGIGNKLASLYLRDIALLFSLEDFIPEDQLDYYQPVDTWVRQVAVKLGITDSSTKDLSTVNEEIVACCVKHKVSPLLFNAGAWLIGAKSFDLLIDSFTS